MSNPLPVTNGRPVPPDHLSAPAARWWADTDRRYQLEDHHRHLLTAAAEALDRMTEARRVLDADGLTFTDRFDQPHPRPEIMIEHNAAIRYARLLRELDLDADTPPDPRPPRRGRR